MTKINSNKKNKVILPVVILAGAIISGVLLANPVISFVTANQPSNMTSSKMGEIFSDQSPKINGSVNVLEKTHAAIENDLKTSFNQAADIATNQSNNDTILLGGHLDIDQGYLVYKFFAINPTNHTGYKTIVDAGNGAVLYKSEEIQMMNFFDRSGGQDRGWHGLPGISGEHGYGHGQQQTHKSFGFGHWIGPWGFHGQGNNIGDGPWR
ncbi:MAG TPA: hypothetical protein VD815_07530 [Candidatus Saccharimonadales bacterium]|nr:hypothetical protein [Candidatus Saccharimonadales bacterium]